MQVRHITKKASRLRCLINVCARSFFSARRCCRHSVSKTRSLSVSSFHLYQVLPSRGRLWNSFEEYAIQFLFWISQSFELVHLWLWEVLPISLPIFLPFFLLSNCTFSVLSWWIGGPTYLQGQFHTVIILAEVLFNLRCRPLIVSPSFFWFQHRHLHAPSRQSSREAFEAPSCDILGMMKL